MNYGLRDALQIKGFFYFNDYLLILMLGIF